MVIARITSPAVLRLRPSISSVIFLRLVNDQCLLYNIAVPIAWNL